MSRNPRLVWLFAACLFSLSGCGDFPRPFQGAPGATAMRLAKPPPPRLAIPAPPEALLPDAASRTFATAIADNLQAEDVPAVAGRVQKGDWQLIATAAERDGVVVPTYTVQNPKGEPQGKADGKPIALADWANASPTTLQQAAADAAPSIATLLSQIQAAIQQSDPNSLYNRPARVMVPDVTGAPGDGDAALTRQMREHLGQLGPVVQNTLNGADFIVQGEVVAVPIAGNQTRIEIQWIVRTASGDERGRVVQLNEVPAGSLNGFWGDVAVAVATEASNGVKDVILRQSGRQQ